MDDAYDSGEGNKMAVVTATRPTEAAASLKTARGPKGVPVLGNVRDMQRDSLGFMLRASKYGDVALIRLMIWDHYLVSHPSGVKRILQENNKNYTKDVLDYNLLKAALGNGLLTNDGDSWLSQRRLMQPAFHRQRLAGFGEMMVDNTVRMLDDRWKRAEQKGRPVDVSVEMHHLTLRIVGMALFGRDMGGEGDQVGDALTRAQRRLTDQFYMPFVPWWVPTPGHRDFHDAMRDLDAVVFKVIGERRDKGGEHHDLLDMLLTARDADTGKGMDDTQVRDEVLTLMLAGHETTANALTWTWYLLSKNPGPARKMREELDRVLGGRTPTAADLPNLNYTRMVLDEAMRLYPPAYAFTRRAIEEDEIQGYRIPAGATVMVSSYVTHHQAAHWENPEGFDPERFAPEREKTRHPYAYFPFGGGPRLCIGNNFALMEGVLILATIGQRYRLDLVPGHPVEVEPLITLRAKHGVRMTLHSAAGRR
jgi:cytochrome P450